MNRVLILVLLFLLSSTSAQSGDKSLLKNRKTSSALFWLNPVKVRYVSSFKEGEFNKFIQSLKQAAKNGELMDLGINTGYIKLRRSFGKTKIILHQNSYGETKSVGHLKLYWDSDKKVSIIRGRLRYRQTRYLYKHYRRDTKIGRWDFSNMLEERFVDLLKQVDLNR
jgi:hypothetical protein